MQSLYSQPTHVLLRKHFFKYQMTVTYMSHLSYIGLKWDLSSLLQSFSSSYIFFQEMMSPATLSYKREVWSPSRLILSFLLYLSGIPTFVWFTIAQLKHFPLSQLLSQSDLLSFIACQPPKLSSCSLCYQNHYFKSQFLSRHFPGFNLLVVFPFLLEIVSVPQHDLEGPLRSGSDKSPALVIRNHLQVSE